MGLFGDIASGILGGANAIYNLYTNKRDFDYQKALQQQIFEREDNAVQRRMADLEAAGINPNLAAGSAAGAGSVVARSSTNDVNMGSALDMVLAKKQIEQQVINAQNARKEGELLDKKNFEQDINNKYLLANVLTHMGIPYTATTFNAFGKKFFDIDYKSGQFTTYESNLSKMFEYQLSQQKNSADLLQKDVDIYALDKAMRYVNMFMPGISFSGKFK